ncbi:hypothetical protein IFM89_017887 [Coptis chinensis]|uniref:Uncharacterized protein n=1 Tax=Coptis chinensis TaxID=261450 RepID=A0A835I5R2_9MAGN|nr:hypothetical protein IFM89_017887 [Coptis chinensis]
MSVLLVRHHQSKRGKTKNNTLINHIARRGQKPRIEIPPGKSKFVGDWSQQFAYEVGIIYHKYAPLSLYHWRKKSFDIDIHRQNCRRKPYDNVTQADWERFCDWFETDKFKEFSTINKAIRAKKKINHRGGSRSF